MTSIVGLWTFADSSSVPISALAAMQREYLANPQLPAVSGIDRRLDFCRKVLERSRRIGRVVAFIRMFSELVFFNRPTPLVRWIRGFVPCEPFTAQDHPSRGGTGFACESACLPASTDAFHRDHEVAYLPDASASSARDVGG